MKTKSYKATFFRHNPQFKNGGYVTERKIEAVSLPSARKRAREVFVDELGTIWKYAEPGAMPRERHDKLYTASSNGRDGEPDLPMADAFDYKIIN